MFNFSGSEIIFLLILGLVVLGPEKLPGVLRKAGRLYGEFKRVTSDAQSELRQAFDQPMRDLQSTAKSYQTFFTDAAKEVTRGPSPTTDAPASEPSASPSPAQSTDSDQTDSPQFIPYESPSESDADDVTPPRAHEDGPAS